MGRGIGIFNEASRPADAMWAALPFFGHWARLGLQKVA
jgi:hypothetical protein